MSTRHTLARLLSPLPLLVVLQGCAARSPSGTVEPAPDTARVAADTIPAPEPAPQDPVMESFQPSAENEVVSDAVRSQRRFIVGDMIRADIATVVEQGSPGVLRVGLGRGFHTQGSREFYFRRLASAYHTWTAEDRPLVVELWEGGRKVGEYSNNVFALGPEHSTPLDCPEDATSGLCSQAGQPAPAPVAEAPAAQPRQMPGPEPVPSTRRRGGFHGNLGVGAGVADLACDGCDDPSRTGFSGYLSLGGWVGDRSVVGVEGTGWASSESGTSSAVWSLTATVTRYLSANSGLFLGAGLGLVEYREDTEGTGADVSAKSVGFSGRLGYDIGTGRFVVVPYVGFVRTFAGADFESDGEDIGFNAAVGNLQFGLSAGIR
jgi:hypothetical protein